MSLVDRMTLADRIERKRLAHKNRAADQQRLTDDVTRQIEKECELVDFIDGTIQGLDNAVDDLTKSYALAPGYVERNNHRIFDAAHRLSDLLRSIQPHQVAAE